jgi:hypothetical protein
MWPSFGSLHTKHKLNQLQIVQILMILDKSNSLSLLHALPLPTCLCPSCPLIFTFWPLSFGPWWKRGRDRESIWDTISLTYYTLYVRFVVCLYTYTLYDTLYVVAYASVRYGDMSCFFTLYFITCHICLFMTIHFISIANKLTLSYTWAYYQYYIVHDYRLWL